MTTAYTLLISFLSALTGVNLETEAVLGTPVAITGGNFNTQIQVSPNGASPLYFERIFSYNRLDLSLFSDINVKLNGATLMSQLLPAIAAVAPLDIIYQSNGSTIDATLTATDIVDVPLPPLLPGVREAIVLTTNPSSLLYTGQVTIIIMG